MSSVCPAWKIYIGCDETESSRLKALNSQRPAWELACCLIFSLYIPATWRQTVCGMCVCVVQIVCVCVCKYRLLHMGLWEPQSNAWGIAYVLSSLSLRQDARHVAMVTATITILTPSFPHRSGSNTKATQEVSHRHLKESGNSTFSFWDGTYGNVLGWGRCRGRYTSLFFFSFFGSDPLPYPFPIPSSFGPVWHSGMSGGGFKRGEERR